MLNDAKSFHKVFIATGYTDLRKGVEGLATIIRYCFDLDPFQKDILFLFCGKKTDRIKGLVWEGDGFLLLYKKLSIGCSFSWPRSGDGVLDISQGQYRLLMEGFDIVAKHPIRESVPENLL